MNFDQSLHPDAQNNSLARNLSSENIWIQSLEIIKARVNNQSFKAWFEPVIPVQFNNNSLTLQVPSQFFIDWLEEHYYSLLSEVLAQITGNEISICYSIAPEEAENRDVGNFELNGMPLTQRTKQENRSIFSDQSVRTSSTRIINPSLNPRYTFENYIKGESNQFARAAATAVANNPGGTSFNPLVIYGGVGLGKTHLVHAIGNHLIQTGKTDRILYVSSEKFTVDFVEAIQKDKVGEFSNFYRSVDLLIVDDIQFFAGKEKTQDVFFHTFNALHQLGKQIVLSSDKPPKDLRGLNERLISRFQWGLTADIQPPDLETRIAILLKKSENERINLPQDVVECIASNVTSNIRELEGCLISLMAKASLEGREITVDLAREVLKVVVGDVRSPLTIETIQRTVCDYFSIPEDLIRAKTRKQEIVNARQVAMYLAKELTNCSLKTIGLHFGGRDHSTVIHAYQSVEDQMRIDQKYQANVQQIRRRLQMLGHV